LGQRAEGRRVALRSDAAFARPVIYEALEALRVQYAIRIPANKNLELAICGGGWCYGRAGRVFRCEIDTGVIRTGTRSV